MHLLLKSIFLQNKPIKFVWRFFLLIHDGIHNIFIIAMSFIYMICLSCFCLLTSQFRKKGYFIGIKEICGNINSTKYALNSCGFHNVTTMAMINRFNKNYPYDYVITIPEWTNSYPNIRKYFIFFQSFFYLPICLLRNEYFIFFWNSTFLPMNLDLLLLKFLNKKIIIFHCGDDVRYRKIHNKLMAQEGVEYRFPSLNEAFPNLEFIKKLFYQKFPNYLNIPIYTLMDIETFLDNNGAYHFRVCQRDFLEPDNKKHNDIPVIIHAPSHREIKGTQVVLEAIEILSTQNIKFDFLLLENKSNNEVIEILKTADVVIDQPGLWCGRLAMEALAHSCIVFGGFNPKYENCNWDLPILPFKKNATTLAENIKKILSLSSLNRLKEESFQGYKRYYSCEKFVEHLNSVLGGNTEKDLFPHPNYKEKLLDAAENSFQRFMIKLFVK